MSQPYFYPMCYGVPHAHVVKQVYQLQPYNLQIPFYRPYPEVDATLLEQSAKSMQRLMRDASLVLNKLADSKSFANKVMSAAQQSNVKEVDKLIQSTGIKSKVITSFNPDGITMKFSSTIGQTECCQLSIALRWL